MPTLLERAVRTALHARGFTSRMVRTSVGHMHVIEKRSASGERTLALLHGLGASTVQLAPLMVRLAPHFDHVIAYDLPGHGFSDVPEPMNAAAMESGTGEVLEKTLTRPVVLFGNSMGGFAAIRFALERPDLVERLVLCSPGGAAMSEDELKELRALFAVDTHQDAVAFLDRLFARPPRLRHLFAILLKKRFADRRFRNLLSEVGTADLFTAEQIAALSRPALVLWGEQDGILPRSGAGFFQQHLGNASVEKLEGFGHSPHMENPGRIAARILAFSQST